MTEKTPVVLSGVVLHEEASLTLEELCRYCATHHDHIVALVRGGILEPAGSEPTQWRFPAKAMTRAARAIRIQRDLELEVTAVAVVLDLLDENAMLRAALKRARGPSGSS